MPPHVKSLAEWEREGIAGMLSVVIPTDNEELTIAFFGLRFSRGGGVVDYSRPKPLLNRNDISNAFEIYRRTVIGGIQPRLAQHFNLSFDPTLAKKSSRSFPVFAWNLPRATLGSLRRDTTGSHGLCLPTACATVLIMVSPERIGAAVAASPRSVNSGSGPA
jgi:hypothetical protein